MPHPYRHALPVNCPFRPSQQTAATGWRPEQARATYPERDCCFPNPARMSLPVQVTPVRAFAERPGEPVRLPAGRPAGQPAAAKPVSAVGLIGKVLRAKVTGIASAKKDTAGS